MNSSGTKDDWKADFRTAENGSLLVSLSGRISLHNLSDLKHHILPLLFKENSTGIIVDLSRVDFLDSAGGLFLVDLERKSLSSHIPFTIQKASQEASGIISLVRNATLVPHASFKPPKQIGMLEDLGEISFGIVSDFAGVVTFLGDLLISLYYAAKNPFTVRWNVCMFYIKRAGVDGLPIVALLSFLLGMIIAFMSSLQLKQFGANLYVASLVGFGMVRELGPIMTAIIFAGRSGSAFAAEIGTMVVNEEVDALITMGFNPTRFLALPKVLAAMLVVPLLTLYSDLFGILGGLTVGVFGFDLTAYTYMKQTISSIDIFDVISSLIKALVFAVLIAGIGCQRGFRVRGGAESVGRFTTSAVVAGLFLIIVADSLFAIVLFYIH
jgi:phospholipid/cholesterol/gamma-HCH transport system permease protein